MSVASSLVLFAVIWFMALFVVLPLRLKTQGDAGKVAPGTPAGAPAELNLKRKLRIVTIASLAIWVALCGVIVSGVVTVRDIDVFDRMGPAASEAIR